MIKKCVSAFLNETENREIFLEIAYVKEYEIAFFKIYQRKTTSVNLIYQNYIYSAESEFLQDIIEHCEYLLKQKINRYYEIPLEGLNFLKER